MISVSDEAELRQLNQHDKPIDEDIVFLYKRTLGYYRKSEVDRYRI